MINVHEQNSKKILINILFNGNSEISSFNIWDYFIGTKSSYSYESSLLSKTDLSLFESVLFVFIIDFASNSVNYYSLDYFLFIKIVFSFSI